MDENKRAILEAVAVAEKQLHPFEDSGDGVSYEDINDEFEMADFGVSPTAYIPPRLAELSNREPPLLEEARDSGSETSANYRLTEHGWNVVDEAAP